MTQEPNLDHIERITELMADLVRTLRRRAAFQRASELFVGVQVTAVMPDGQRMSFNEDDLVPPNHHHRDGLTNTLIGFINWRIDRLVDDLRELGVEVSPDARS